MLADFRYALRTLRNAPGFVAVAVVCLALGIGLNTSTFSMVNGLLIRALPFADADRMVMLYTSRPAHGIAERNLSFPEILDLRERSRTLAVIAGQYGGGFNIAGEHETERVDGEYVTHEMLPMVGVRPMLGRFFLPEEDRPGGPKVVILSHDLWERRFEARRDIVGSRVLLNGAPYTVVGVMPRGFRFPLTERLWVPMAADPNQGRDARDLWTIARLRPGATPEQAHAEIRAIGQRFAAEYPAATNGWEFNVKPLSHEFPEEQLRTMMGLMLGSVSFVVLIVCANLANLLLARAAGRARELALRAAVGATRGRIVRQLLIESVLVSLAGGALGILVAQWYIDHQLASIPEEIPYWVQITLDPLVLAYTLGLSVLTGVVFGTLPALRATRHDLHATLKAGGRAGVGRERARLRAGLVVAQVSLAVVLLVGAALMVRSFVAMRLFDAGVDRGHLLTLRTHLAGERYDAVAARADFYARLAQRLEALPGVRRAAASSVIPAEDGGMTAALVVEGQAVQPGDELMVTTMGEMPGALDAIGASLLAGRDFTAQEVADTAASVAIVNRELAERLWPGQSALGRRVRVRPVGREWMTVTVVGLAPDVTYEEFIEQSPEDRLQVHVPYARLPFRGMGVMVRTDGEPGAVAAAVRRELRALDATLPAFDVRTMDEILAFTTWPYKLYGKSFGLFGGLALVLAAVGVYGVVAYTVAQRRHEIGVRMALGARAATVAREIVRGAARLAVPGVLVGLAGALALSRLLRGALYGISTTDLATFAGVPAVIVGVALVASWLPARRAARVDPATALRSE
jgi:putative ABC transport system permease protein